MKEGGILEVEASMAADCGASWTVSADAAAGKKIYLVLLITEAIPSQTTYFDNNGGLE